MMNAQQTAGIAQLCRSTDGLFVGIEFALSVDKSVGRRRPLQRDERSAEHLLTEELAIQIDTGFAQYADGDFYPTLAQNVEAATAHFRKGIDTTHHTLANAAAHDER